MNTYFATFGTGHAYAGCFVEIIADSQPVAEAHMAREHGQRWGNVYPAADHPGLMERQRLQKLVTVRQRPGYPAETPFFDVERSA